jgi:hypothetical protein
MVLSAVGVSRRMNGVASPALVMSTTQSIRARRLTAATVPTRWPVPRPSAGRHSAAAGGCHGFAIGCSCCVDLRSAYPRVCDSSVDSADEATTLSKIE